MTAPVRERLDDGIEVLRPDRPQARNALDSATPAALESALGVEWQRSGAGRPRGGWFAFRASAHYAPAKRFGRSCDGRHGPG